MKGFLIRLLLLCVLVRMPAQAEFFQGSIGRYPIWMNLSIPQADDSVRGEYFYAKQGEPIPLRGMRARDSAHLEERDVGMELTGELHFAIRRQSLRGIWRREAGGKALVFAVKPVSAKAYHRAAIDARNRRLDREDSSRISRDREGSDTSHDSENNCEKADQVSYHFKNDHIRSIQVFHDMSVCGGYPNGESEFITYNAGTGEGISFWEEVDSASRGTLQSIVKARMQKLLTEHRRRQSDSLWMEVLQDASLDSSARNAQGEPILDRVFSADHPFTEYFYVSENGIELVWRSDHGFPHVMQALEFHDGFTLTFADLDRFLKTRSALRWADKSLRKKGDPDE